MSSQHEPKNDPIPADDSKLNWVRWWGAPGGPGPLLQIAMPLMIAAGFVSITLFTDRTLLYWKSESEASAAMGGGSIYWTIACLPMGLLGYISTFVAQYRGAGESLSIGTAYRHAIRLAWLLVPVFLLAMWIAPVLFESSGHTEHLVALETQYLRILLIGGIGVLFYSVQSGLLTGHERTATVLSIDGIATAVNLALDFVLIFGWGPIPAFGLAGAAIATSASFWIKIPIAHWVIRRDQTLVEEYEVLARHAWDWGIIRRLITFGGPAGLQMLAESACFAVILLQVGRLGELEMAATTLALGINVLAFVPMMGLGIGLGVIVGRRLTEGRADLAHRSVMSALLVTVCYTSMFALVLGLVPEWTIAIYRQGTPQERFANIQPLLIPLIRFIALYCILDGLQIVFVGAIKGAGDTWFVLGTTIFISVSAVLAGYLCQWYQGPSLHLWWYIITGWVATMGFAFASRYLSGAWKSKRVIETRVSSTVS
ncbi:MAG: MATE family efflux transporter [Aureliella sp.]